MKKILLEKMILAAIGGLLMTGFLSAPLLAQEDTALSDLPREERREVMAQRRAEFRENNPEAAARMHENRQRRQEYRENNPEEAAARREQRRERRENGEGPRRGFEGHRPGPPSGDE